MKMVGFKALHPQNDMRRETIANSQQPTANSQQPIANRYPLYTCAKNGLCAASSP